MTENNRTYSNRGGARRGAGRKPGSATKRTREIADRAIEDGMTPLEYMLQLMRAPSDHDDPHIQAQREAMRFEAAKAAAPYIHPRLQAIEHTGTNGGAVDPGLPPDGFDWLGFPIEPSGTPPSAG